MDGHRLRRVGVERDVFAREPGLEPVGRQIDRHSVADWRHRRVRVHGQARPMIRAAPRSSHARRRPQRPPDTKNVRTIPLQPLQIRTGRRNRCRSLRHIGEISVIHKKRASKSGIGDACGLELEGRPGPNLGRIGRPSPHAASRDPPEFRESVTSRAAVLTRGVRWIREIPGNIRGHPSGQPMQFRHVVQAARCHCSGESSGCGPDPWS